MQMRFLKQQNHWPIQQYQLQQLCNVKEMKNKIIKSVRTLPQQPEKLQIMYRFL